MTKLEQLINDLCPNGVEYKKIGDIADYEQPSKYLVKSTDYSDDFSIPVLTAGQTFILGYTNENNGVYQASKEKPVIIFDDFTGAFKWVDFPFKAKSSAMKMITAKSGVLIRYLYHLMGFLNYTSDEHKRLWISIYSELKIPLPPLEIQREIVRILDNFTELTAELTARKQQYEYYRDQLLSFDSVHGGATTDVQWGTLGEIAEISTGSSNTDDAEENGVYPFYVRSQEPLRKNQYEYDEEAIITAGDGVGVGKVFHYVNGKYALHQRAYRIHPNDSDLLGKYLYHYFIAKFPAYIGKQMYQGSVPSIRRPMLNNFKVAVPSLKTQNRIVDVLDNFDAICNDLNIGLPKEIELRQKQYEYYRDCLLTFAETGNIISQSRAEQSRAEQSRAEQSRAEQSRAEQSRT